MSRPRIEGFGHIDLSVTDGERSVRWSTEVLGTRLAVSSKKLGVLRQEHVSPSSTPT
jgi:hypothetical protein